MSTQTIASTADIDDQSTRIADLINEYKKMRSDEYWLLEPGDPFYEEYEAFDAINGDGPKTTNFVQYFTQDGKATSADWNAIKPKRLSAIDLSHFRRTPNRMLIGRDGTIIVSAGTWGRREKPEGGYEYLPIDEYRQWLGEQMKNSERAVVNRPAWAEEVVAWVTFNRLDYQLKRGDIEYKQSLVVDGLSEPEGHVNAYFKSAEDLRALANEALAFADLIDEASR